MISQVTLKAMTAAEVQNHLGQVMDELHEICPVDTAGALLLLWDDLGNMHFRGEAPNAIKSGEGLRKVAAFLDEHRSKSDGGQIADPEPPEMDAAS